MKQFIFVLLIGACFARIQAQEVKVTVLDVETNEPVSFAHVCVQSIDKLLIRNYLSDTTGVAHIKFEKPSLVIISSMGYVHTIDTIYAPTSKTVRLKPSNFQFEEVVVTAQIDPKKKDQSIYKVDVITNRNIEQKGAGNLEELLRNDINFRVTQDPSLGSGLSINGLSGEHIKIMVDGVPLIGRQNGTLDLSQINLSNVQHIEVVKGPMSVIYGSNALAGVINIISATDNRHRYFVRTHANYETVGSYRFNVNGGSNIGKHRITIGGERNFFSGFNPSGVQTRSSLWKPKLQYQGNVSYRYTGKKIRVEVKSDLFWEELRSLAHDSTYSPKEITGTNLQAQVFSDQYFYTFRNNYKVNLNYQLSPKLKFNQTGAYSAYRKMKNSYNFNSYEVTKELMNDTSAHDTTTINNIFVRGTASYTPKKGLQLQLGYDINYEDATGKRIAKGGDDLGESALFALAMIEPHKLFKFQAGGRAIYHTDYKAPFVYAASTRFGDRKHFIRASYGKGFRAPSLKELYMEFVDINHNIVGNANLKAETSSTINVNAQSSFSHNKHQLTIEPEVFYNQFNNKILLAQDGETYSYFNLEDYVTKGVQVGVTYRYHPRVLVELSTITIGETIPNAKQSFYYNTDFSGRFDYFNVKYRFNISLYYKYTGNYQKYVLSDTDQHPTAYTEESYHNLDLTFIKSFYNEKIRVSLGGKNLFNVTNISSIGGGSGVHTGGGSNTPVLWGRTAFVSLTYHFKKY